MNKRKEKIISMLPPLLLLVVTFCVYMPSTLFLGNIDEFAIDYIKIVPVILMVSLSVSAVIILVGIIPFPEKVFNIYRMLIFGGSVGFYIQGNFLNPKFNSLNGAEIDWSGYTTEGIISTCVWILCLIAPVILYIFRKDIMNNISKYLSLFLSAVQLVSLIAVVISTGKNVDSSYALTKNEEFTISAKKNVVTFVVDTLDAQWAEQYITSNNAYYEMFQGFTYFDNVVAGGAPTELGIPTLLTGVNYDTELTSEEYHYEAYSQSSLFKDLQDSDFDVKIYTDYSYLNGADKENINNLVSGQEYTIASFYNFTKYLYKLTGFYAMPQLLKSWFWFYGNDLSECVKVDDENVNLYYFDDPQFYRDLRSQGLSINNNKNEFILYHLMGAHAPYTMNEECDNVSEAETSIEQQIYGSFKIIGDYIEEMKKAGVYDNSTIIITADHGGAGLYQNPAVFIKRAGADDAQLEVNTSPVTFKNLRATMAEQAIGNYKAYGPTMYEMAGNTDVRYHVAPQEIGVRVYPDNSYIKGREWALYAIKGRARDMDSISVVEQN